MNPIKRYLQRKAIINNTRFIIDSTGEGYYILDGKRIPKKEFEAQHNIGVFPRANIKGKSASSANRWMNSDIDFD